MPQKMQWIRMETRIREALRQHYAGFEPDKQKTIDIIDFIVADETLRGSERVFSGDETDRPFIGINI